MGLKRIKVSDSCSFHRSFSLDLANHEIRDRIEHLEKVGEIRTGSVVGGLKKQSKA